MDKLFLALERIFLFILFLCLYPLILYVIICLSPTWITLLIISFFKKYQENQLIAHKTANKEDDKDKYYIDNKGYYRFSNSNKLVHRWIKEKELGRKLLENEVIHHIDGDKRNNNPSNLLCCTSEEHNRIHHNNLIEYHSWHKPVLNYNQSYNKISS